MNRNKQAAKKRKEGAEEVHNPAKGDGVEAGKVPKSRAKQPNGKPAQKRKARLARASTTKAGQKPAKRVKSARSDESEEEGEDEEDEGSNSTSDIELSESSEDETEADDVEDVQAGGLNEASTTYEAAAMLVGALQLIDTNKKLPNGDWAKLYAMAKPFWLYCRSLQCMSSEPVYTNKVQPSQAAWSTIRAVAELTCRNKPAAGAGGDVQADTGEADVGTFEGDSGSGSENESSEEDSDEGDRRACKQVGKDPKVKMSTKLGRHEVRFLATERAPMASIAAMQWTRCRNGAVFADTKAMAGYHGLIDGDMFPKSLPAVRDYLTTGVMKSIMDFGKEPKKYSESSINKAINQFIDFTKAFYKRKHPLAVILQTVHDEDVIEEKIAEYKAVAKAKGHDEVKQEALAGEGVVTWLNAGIHSWQKKVLRKLKANYKNTKPVKSKAGKRVLRYAYLRGYKPPKELDFAAAPQFKVHKCKTGTTTASFKKTSGATSGGSGGKWQQYGKRGEVQAKAAQADGAAEQTATVFIPAASGGTDITGMKAMPSEWKECVGKEYKEFVKIAPQAANLVINGRKACSRFVINGTKPGVGCKFGDKCNYSHDKTWSA